MLRCGRWPILPSPAARYARSISSHVSNDNPFSEAQFKTLKYRPAFPERFGSIQDARGHCHVFSPGTTPSTDTPASAC